MSFSSTPILVAVAAFGLLSGFVFVLAVTVAVARIIKPSPVFQRKILFPMFVTGSMAGISAFACFSLLYLQFHGFAVSGDSVALRYAWPRSMVQLPRASLVRCEFVADSRGGGHVEVETLDHQYRGSGVKRKRASEVREFVARIR
jgi:hypothetical protein